MTNAEKLAMVKTMSGETDDGIVSAYLSLAGSKICRKVYPFGGLATNVPDQYAHAQVEIAVYLLNKRGAEGQTSHSENGISRSYESADIPSTLLRDIVPLASVIGGETVKNMEKNKTLFWYLLYDRQEEVVDEDGSETGEVRVLYHPAVPAKVNISAATGTSQVEQFGNFAGYDKVIVTDDLTCPIDENTVLFIDKEPEYREDGTPLYDYIVKRVARSLNSVAYAVSKVSVS